MDEPEEIARALLTNVTDSQRSYEDAMSAAGQLLEAAVPGENLNQLLNVVRDGIDAEDAERAGIAAIVCGALVERGADAALVGEQLVSGLRRVAAAAEEYLDACREYFQTNILSDEAQCEICGPGEDEQDIMMPQVRRAVSETMPHGESAWVALDLFCRPTVTVLTRLSELRAATAEDAAFVFRCGILAQHQPGAYFVFAALSVLDDEVLLVLEPATRKGFEVRMSGVADNFQLHLLLAHLLIGGGHVDGEAPPEDVVAQMLGQRSGRASDYVVGWWNLYNWTALRPDGSLPDGYFDTGSEHWIWNEGVPADIQDFDGRRVVLLAPTPYVRSWTPARLFDALAAEIEIDSVLSDADVDEWLRRMIARSAEQRALNAT